jgi:hypothetical protein
MSDKPQITTMKKLAANVLKQSFNKRKRSCLMAIPLLVVLIAVVGGVSQSQRSRRAEVPTQTIRKQAPVSSTLAQSQSQASPANDSQTAVPATNQSSASNAPPSNQGIAPKDKQSQLQQNNQYSSPHIQYNRALSCPAAITFTKQPTGYWQGQGNTWQIANTENDPMFARSINANNLGFVAGQAAPGEAGTSTSWPASLNTYGGVSYSGELDFAIDMNGTSGRIYSCTIHVTFLDS